MPIASNTVNAVAMTVLPNAPVDPVTQLPVPTIAVSCGTLGVNTGNVTVLKDDGTAVNSNVTYPPQAIGIDSKYNLLSSNAIGLSAYSRFASLIGIANNFSWTFNTTSAPAGTGSDNKYLVGAGKGYADWDATRNILQVYRLNQSTPAASLMARITGTYNTGWMVGDVRRALAADTVNGTASDAEKITNGTFTTDASGWTGGNATLSASGGQLVVTATVTSSPNASQSFTTVPGKTYRWTVDLIRGTTPNSNQVRVGLGPGNVELAQVQSSTTGTITSTFVATATTTYISVGYGETATGQTSMWDNISVKEVVADRSVKAKPASINGTLAMTAVASAAQLVAYSGFSNDPAQTTDILGGAGDFSSASGWSTDTGWSIASGQATAVASGGAKTIYRSGVPIVSGRAYVLKFDLVSRTAGTVYGYVGAGSGTPVSTPGTYYQVITAAANQLVGVQGDAAFAGVVDNVQLLPYAAVGSAANAIQEASSADLDYGTAAWMAEGWCNVPSTGFGPHNIVATSTPNTGAGWTVTSATTTLNATTAPDGTSTASKVVEGVATSTHSVAASYTSASANTTYTGSVYLKAAERTRALVQLTDTATGDVRVEFDLSAGAVVATALTGNWSGVQSGFTALANGWYRVWIQGTKTSGANSTATLGCSLMKGVGVINYAGDGTSGLYAWGGQINRGAIQSFWATSGVAYNGIAPILDRSGPSGAYWRLGIDGAGMLAAEAYDGTTTRRVTSTVAVNDGTWHQAMVDYATTGALTLKLDGVQNAQTTGAALLTLNNSNALLTLGNSFALNAAFPGSVALVKTGATVPFAEQSAFMYAQERAIFQPGVQCCLADTGAVLDLSYDDLEDKVSVATAANQASFVGLVRVSNTPVAAGSYSKVAHRAGWKLVARTTTNPGVDISVGSLNLREQLLKRAEEAARLARLPEMLDFDATASQTDFVLPVGYEPASVYAAGTLQRSGSSKAYVVNDDGFKQTVKFNTGQALNTWVRINNRRQP